MSRSDPFWSSLVVRAGILGAIGLAVSLSVGWASSVGDRLTELEKQRAADVEWRKAVSDKLDGIAFDVRALKK